jgi:hypothetical protein
MFNDELRQIIKIQTWFGDAKNDEIDRLKVKFNQQKSLVVNEKGQLMDNSNSDKGTKIKPQTFFFIIGGRKTPYD